jgi:large conductance mechanosensitive channel
MSMFKEFREFAMKGSVVDLAVGVIIGAAFGKIVTSMVDDIIMPLVGMALGHVDFKDLAIHLAPAVEATNGHPAVPAVDVRYGLFLNNVINFVIVAFCIFMVVKQMNRMRSEPPKP